MGRQLFWDYRREQHRLWGICYRLKIKHSKRWRGCERCYSQVCHLPIDASSCLTSHMLHRIGIAIGPETWFVNEFGANVSSSGTVLNNRLSGAFGYGIAITSANNFTVQGNTLFGNTSFIGSRGPNCSASDPTPPSAAFIVGSVNVTASNLQSQFQSVQDAKGLTCVIPPSGGDYWPYGGNPTSTSTSSTATSTSGESPSKHSSAGSKAGLAIGIIVAVVAVIVGIILVRRWALNRQLMKSVSRGGVHPRSVKKG
jgi:parallel beta-helix repeat protein